MAGLVEVLGSAETSDGCLRISARDNSLGPYEEGLSRHRASQTRKYGTSSLDIHQGIRKRIPKSQQRTLSWDHWSQPIKIQFCRNREGYVVGLGQGGPIWGPASWRWARKQGLSSRNKAKWRFLIVAGDGRTG